MLERSDVADDPVLRMPAHGAGYVQHQLGPLDLVGKAKAHLGKHSLDTLPVADVLLTAVHPDAGQRLINISREYQILDKRLILPLLFHLLRGDGFGFPQLTAQGRAPKLMNDLLP